MITVSSADSDVAGSRRILICNIALPTGVTVSEVPSVQWRRPSGVSSTGTVFPVGKSLYNSQLIFNPLTLSDGGDYTCTATYSLGGQTSASGTGTHSFSVISKCTNSIILITIVMVIIIISKILFYSTRVISDSASER